MSLLSQLSTSAETILDDHPLTVKPYGLLVGNLPEYLETVWAAEQRARLASLVQLNPWIWNGTADLTEELAEGTEVIFSTWGMPRMTSKQLDCFPKLRAVFYAAGGVKGFVDPLFERGIQVFSAWSANAVPVAEYTIAQILFALKQGWLHLHQFRDHPGPESWRVLPITGNYGAKVGIISLGMIGSKVCDLLQPFHMERLVYDPYVQAETMRERGLVAVSLEELFATCDVVTLHAPELEETEGMITGSLLRSMKPGTTFINTSRGAVVREADLIEVLQERPDLTAVLDVTEPEPPVAGSPLYTLRNVVLTPHISGSRGAEVRRMADWMMDEFVEWSAGGEIRYEVKRENLARMA